jgi:hypothetical protein
METRSVPSEKKLVKQELATLKANMTTIVENQVENRVNKNLPILIHSIEDWIAGGR